MIKLQATLNVRTPAGKFAPASYARVLAPARQQIARDVQQAFARAADPVNWRRWQPRKGDYPWPPLNRTGAMMAAEVRAAAGAALFGNTLVVRVKAPRYAAFHAKGTKTLAARRSVGISLQTLNATKKALKAEGVRVFRGRA